MDLDWYWEKHRENALGAYSQRGIDLNRIPEFGAALWKSVFYENCPIGGMSSDEIISITLTSADPNFLALPWELMRDQVNEKPAALRGASIARSLQISLLSVRHQGQPIKRILLVTLGRLVFMRQVWAALAALWVLILPALRSTSPC